MLLYPLWIRIWHFLNALLIIILILTGVLMQFTGTDSKLLIALFPGSARLHDVCAIILTISYMAFVAGNIISDNGKHYKLKRKDIIPGSAIQLKYFTWGMFRRAKIPFPVTEDNKFNPLEKITYLLVMYAALPLLIMSGIIMLFPDMEIIISMGKGFYVFSDILHIVTGFVISMFLVIHIYTCTITSKPGSIFRSIISGYREPEE
ncbi:MAG: cytochrome b/b6 domain-containing protein [Bacteroidota bacterium]